MTVKYKHALSAVPCSYSKIHVTSNESTTLVNATVKRLSEETEVEK